MTTKTLAAFCILALFVAILFFDVLLGDKVLLTESPFSYAPWRAYAGKDDPTDRAGRADCLRTYLPRQVEISRSIRSGRLPLWNPYIYGGIPFLADPQARAVYPFSLLLSLFDPVKAMGYDVAIHTLIAMIGMYLFMYAIRAGSYGSLIGALAYGFSSFLFTRHGHPTFVAAASWIPFLFYAFERSRIRATSGTLLLAVSLAMGYLSGHPQVFLLGVCALGIYVILMCIEDAAGTGGCRAVSNLKIIAVAGLLSTLLVAVQLLPFLEFLRNSVGLDTDLGDIRAPSQSHPVFFLRILFPDFFGNPLKGTSWLGAVEIAGRNWYPPLIYCGVGSALLALGSCVFIRVSKHIRAMAVLLAVSLGIGSSSLLLKAAVGALPMIGYTNIGRVSVVSCFALAALAGKGYSIMTSAGNHRLKRYAVLIAASLVVIMLLMLLVLIFQGESVMSGLMKSIEGSLETLSGRQRSMEFMRWIADGTAKWLAYETRQVTVGVVFGAIGLALITAHTLKRPTNARLGGLVAAGFIIVLAVDLGIAARSYYASQPGSSFFETEGIRTLRSAVGKLGGWRIMSDDPRGRVFPPNINQVFGIPSGQGRATIIPDTFPHLVKLRRRRFASPVGQHRQYRSDVSAAADLMSVRFLTAEQPEPEWLASPILRAIAASKHLQPRLRVVSMGKDNRLSFCQSMDESLTLEIDLPGAKWLDLAIGLSLDRRSKCDSVEINVRCETADRSQVLTKRLDPLRDAGKWHELSLDISSMQRGPAKITMAALAVGTQGDCGLIIGWSELEFVAGRCRTEKVQGGYMISRADPHLPLSVEISSDAHEVPLHIRSGDSPPVSRWIGFPPGSASRHITFDIGGLRAQDLMFTSDSTFTLRRCKNVNAGAQWSPGFEPFYSGDMLIFENSSAYSRGICIDSRGVSFTGREGTPVLHISPPDSLDLLRCGECTVVSYRSESVELDITADRACYLIFQDTYYPGWRARVDGASREILRTDIGIRAIELSKGDHSVTMEFRPRSFSLGVFVTLIGIALASVYVLMTHTLSRRRQDCK